MKSTDHNINNPLKCICIDLLRTVESWDFPNTLKVTQEKYDLIQIHDPHTIYTITDSSDGRSYYGDALIINDNVSIKYYLGQNDKNEYVIYVNQLAGTGNNNVQQLVPICAYNDPQTAIDALSKCNKTGSHIKRDLDIYNIIKSYIDKYISTHEFIISIIAAFNFKEDPRLQTLIEFAVGHNSHKCSREFPPFYADQLPRMRDYYPESLFVIYSNLYDLIVKYNFFKDKKYEDVNVNLSKEITEIFKIMLYK